MRLTARSADAGAMFGRTKKKDVASINTDGRAVAVIERVVATTLPSGPVSACTAFREVTSVAEGFCSDARLFLVLSTDVHPDGLADNWQFHYMFPSMHAEGVLTVRTVSRGGSDVHAVLTPCPAPGTPEHTMAHSGGPYMSIVVEEAWKARLDRISGLPLDFHDSTEAVSEMERQGNSLFVAGGLRLKGRMLPSGASVWELVTPAGVVQTRFGRDI
jgi:hypothetical protein